MGKLKQTLKQRPYIIAPDDALSLSDATIHDVGSDVNIDFAPGTTLILEGISASQVSADWFV